MADSVKVPDTSLVPAVAPPIKQTTGIDPGFATIQRQLEAQWDEPLEMPSYSPEMAERAAANLLSQPVSPDPVQAEVATPSIQQMCMDCAEEQQAEEEKPQIQPKLAIAQPVDKYGQAASCGVQQVVSRIQSSESRPVQRQATSPTAAATCTLNASMFTVSGATPQSSGIVTDHVDPAADTITLEAPRIQYSADVQLSSSFCSGSSETVEVGPTQTVNSSSRIGIYREAGLATGNIVAQKHQNVNNVRDAQWTTDSRGEIVASFPEPWYGRPYTLSNVSPQATVGFVDQPVAEFPRQIGNNGFLTETQGADSFTVGLTAKKDGQLLHLSFHDWSVPWTMDLIAHNQGLPISVTPASAGPSVTTGPIAMNASQEWIFFPTVAAAEAAGVRTLLDNLIPNHQYDTSRVSYLNIIQALRNKDPKFQFTVTVNETADWWGDDELSISVTGLSTARRGPFSLGEGDSQSFEVSLQEVYHDPILMSAGSSLLVIARDEGQGHRHGTIDWPYPFHDQSSPAHFSGEDGEYTLTGALST